MRDRPLSLRIAIRERTDAGPRASEPRPILTTRERRSPAARRQQRRRRRRTPGISIRSTWLPSSSCFILPSANLTKYQRLITTTPSSQGAVPDQHFHQIQSNNNSKMAILSSTVKYGSLFMIAREGLKAYEQHNGNNQGQQQQQQPMYNQYSPQQPQYQQQSREIQSTYQQQPSDIYSQQPAGSFHQVWCNGRCGGRCGAKEALMAVSGQQGQRQHANEKPPPPY